MADLTIPPSPSPAPTDTARHSATVISLASRRALKLVRQPTAAKCMRAYELLEQAWDLIHDVLEDADWKTRIPAAFPEQAVEPLRSAICFMRPAENFPPGTTRAQMNTAVEAEDASRH